jgi:hypothetical protein
MQGMLSCQKLDVYRRSIEFVAMAVDISGQLPADTLSCVTSFDVQLFRCR